MNSAIVIAVAVGIIMQETKSHASDGTRIVAVQPILKKGVPIEVLVKMEEIPTLNWDHTGLHYIPVSNWTMAEEGCVWKFLV